MLVLIDNTVATIVGMTIMLILLVINVRGKQSSERATVFYDKNTMALTFTEILSRDMRNLSRVVTTEETDSTFIFFAQTEPSDTTKNLVEYRRFYTGQHDGENLYRISRYVDQVNTWSGIPTLTYWEIVAQDENGNTVGGPGEARQVFIRFEAVRPFHAKTEEGIGEDKISWESRYLPYLLGDMNL